MTSKERVFEELIDTIVRMGYPKEFGTMIAMSLSGEKSMSRMSSYLHQYRPASAEEITDEMLAILEDNNRFREKKISEYYNKKLNVLMNEGFGDDTEEEI